MGGAGRMLEQSGLTGRLFSYDATGLIPFRRSSSAPVAGPDGHFRGRSCVEVRLLKRVCSNCDAVVSAAVGVQAGARRRQAYHSRRRRSLRRSGRRRRWPSDKYLLVVLFVRRFHRVEGLGPMCRQGRCVLGGRLGGTGQSAAARGLVQPPCSSSVSRDRHPWRGVRMARRSPGPRWKSLRSRGASSPI